MSKRIVPVILAGGSGTRLWPLSREAYPKQFCCLFGERSLLQHTVARANAVSDHAPLIVVTNDHYFFLCKDQLEAMGVHNAHYILEPCLRNTAPAILLAAAYAEQYMDPQATLLVMPSDHHMKNETHFKHVVQHAHRLADRGKLIVFGVTPTSPNTGYGYIEVGEPLEKDVYTVSRFVEKPTREVANTYLAQGDFYWNSGLFLFTAMTYRHALSFYAKDVYAASMAAFRASTPQADFCRVDASFSACRSASIDYEVMERTDNAVMLPLGVYWNDLGCWASVAESGASDESGNVLRGNVCAKDTENCLLSAEARYVMALGVKNQVIVSTPDAVLVADKAYSQAIKHVVSEMKQQADPIATEHHRVYRPWGYYETVSVGEGYRVKRLMVHPGGQLSLQRHRYRSEHWVVVRGEAAVQNGSEVFALCANQSTYIEKNTKHRLSNPGTAPLFVIEVQSGDYVGEDDIERFEDEYGRLVEPMLE
jgi:mannose-1-phosphate guanylyltransferase/mannose-6-phosphate isomerase